MKPILITSAQNDLYKQLKLLTDSKAIKKQGRFLLSGNKVNQEILKSRPDSVLGAVTVTGDSESLRHFESLRVPVLILDKPLFAEVDQFGTHQPLLICKLPQLPTWQPSDPILGLELMLTQGDPANLGAAIRSAAAFGVKRIVLLKEAASPFHPRAVRASSGTVLTAPLASGPSVKDLDTCTHLVILDLRGTDLSAFHWPEKARLLVGEEGPGISATLHGERICIPINTQVESLNATIATAIGLYGYRTQHPLNPQ
jgi:tRNA G18 (ribose-2'-O)-methylase SpoU